MNTIPIRHVYERYNETAFELPLSPSVNEAYVPQIHKKRGEDGKTKQFVRTVASLKLQEYKWQARSALQKQQVWSDQWGSARSLGYEADIYVPTRGSDLDNRNKGFLDALCQLGFNDNRIDEIHLYRHIDKDDPHIDVVLWIIE